MSETIIRAKGLGKKYSVRNKPAEKYVALRDILSNSRTHFIKKLSRHRETSLRNDFFWALEDISFEVKRGDVVGIIGHNGAGKSTLLKILSRITEPTTGFVEIQGRIASLLEVGTGFHPELTGRENIFLNGAILGMSRSEIVKKFEEIVDFAEIERFLDTPVKRYSSGMYMRLAFSVAAHLEPEILVVDEILAVGDIKFQNKCFGKMNNIARGGRTVLLVSHNMSAIQHLCHSAIHMSQGKIMGQGETSSIIQSYLSAMETDQRSESLINRKRANGLGELVMITCCNLSSSRKEYDTSFLFGEPLSMSITTISSTFLENLSIIFQIDSFSGETIVTASSEFAIDSLSMNKSVESKISATFKDLVLMPGKYWVTVSIRQGRIGLDQVRQARAFEVSEVSTPETSPHPATWGYVQSFPEWKIDSES